MMHCEEWATTHYVGSNHSYGVDAAAMYGSCVFEIACLAFRLSFLSAVGKDER